MLLEKSGMARLLANPFYLVKLGKIVPLEIQGMVEWKSVK